MKKLLVLLALLLALTMVFVACQNTEQPDDTTVADQPTEEPTQAPTEESRQETPTEGTPEPEPSDEPEESSTDESPEQLRAA